MSEASVNITVAEIHPLSHEKILITLKKKREMELVFLYNAMAFLLHSTTLRPSVQFVAVTEMEKKNKR